MQLTTHVTAIGLVLFGVAIADAEDTRFGTSSQRSGQLFRGISVPGNYIGTAAQTVPGVALPNQERRFPDKVPFSPTTSVFGSTFNNSPKNSWGYGQVLHGVNPLDMDARSLHEAYSQASRPMKSDGQTFPFDSVVSVGGEHDAQKWKYLTGGMRIPTLSRDGPEVFDLKGHVQERKRNLQANVDFPVLGTNERFPLSAKYAAGKLASTMQFGQALPNVNPFHLPKEQILEQLQKDGNPNPTFLG